MSEPNIFALDERIKALEGWQKRQNGSIQRVEDKLEKLQWWIMGQLAAVVMLALSIWIGGR